MFLLYSLGAPIWPIGVGGPWVRPVRAHSSYATVRYFVKHFPGSNAAGAAEHFPALVHGSVCFQQ